MRFESIAEKLEKNSDYSNFEIRAFMKRIIKMLILGIRPVIVFDGTPPRLKSKTLLERRRRRFKVSINYEKVMQLFLLKMSKMGDKEKKTFEEKMKKIDEFQFEEMDDKDIKEVTGLMKEFEQIYEEEEEKEKEVSKRIFIEENKRLIKENEYSLKEFKELNDDVQLELVQLWKNHRRASQRKKLESETNHEAASRIQFESYVQNAEKKVEDKKFRNKIMKENEQKSMEKNPELNLMNQRADLIFRKRVDWNKNKVLYMFKEDKEAARRRKRDEIFTRKARRYVTKKERLRVLDEMQRKIGSHLLQFDENDRDFVNIMHDTCSRIFTENLIEEQKHEEDTKEARNSEFEYFGGMPKDQLTDKEIIERREQGLADVYKETNGRAIDEIFFEMEECEEESLFQSQKPGSEVQRENEVEEPDQEFEEKIKQSMVMIKKVEEDDEDDKEKEEKVKPVEITDRFRNWMAEEEEFMREELPFIPGGESYLRFKPEQGGTKGEGVKSRNIFEYFSGGFTDEGNIEKQEEKYQKLKEMMLKRRSTEMERQSQNLEDQISSMKTKKGEAYQHLKLLLKLFGIPWVQSPSEAEAQCAKLEQMGLVDGSVTEDSDIFLFGSRNVFKGFFDKSSTKVSQYTAKGVKENLGLDREKLIMLALFLGCDYCDGIKGVGLVNGMEIVNTYEDFESLVRWKDWAIRPDLWLKVDQGKNDFDIYSNARENYPKEYQYMLQHKNYKNVWEVPKEFPNFDIMEAFVKPEVREDVSIKWKDPDFDNIEVFCKDIIEMHPREIELFLEPLKKEFNNRKNQAKITQFFEQGEKLGNVVSSRLNQAVTNLKKKYKNEGKMDEEESQGVRTRAKRTKKQAKKAKGEKRGRRIKQ